MELIDLLRVVRRWLWLIVAVVVVTELALWLGTRFTEPVYATNVRMQLSAPQREEVAAYDEYRSISLRDEITTAINNFMELLQSDEVYKRTISQLGLVEKDAQYTIAVNRLSDADFVDVTVEARTPKLAAEIANTHVAIAIAYYGELRAQSTRAEKDLFAEQLGVAENKYRTAEKALADFRTQNGIFSLESQMSTQQRLLEQLQLERDQRYLEQATTVVTTTDSTIEKGATPTVLPVIDPVAEVDKLIVQRLKELDQFTALTPQYNILSQNVEQARAVYEHLMSKYSEAEVKVTAVQAANFIQVIKPAYVPVESAESSWPKLAVLALAGSLGLGVVLAFLLEYITSFETASVTVPVSDPKTPSPGQAGREFWKPFRNIFRRNDPSYERVSLVSPINPAAKQEPIAVQEQQNSTLEAASETIPVSDQITPTDELAILVLPTDPVTGQQPITLHGQQDSTLEAASENVSVSDQKTTSYDHASLMSSTDPVAEQEPIAVQEPDSTLNAASETVPVSALKTPSRKKQSSRKTHSTDVEQEPIAVQELDSTFNATSVIDPVSALKTPSGKKRSSRKTPSTVAEQKPIVVQSQPGSTEINYKAASVTVPMSEHKTPSGKKRSSRKTPSTIAAQEPIALQGPLGSTETNIA